MRKALFLTIFLFLFSTLPARAALTTIFSDDFEGDLSGWQTQIPPGCTLQIQTPPANRISPTGGKQVFLYQSQTNQTDCFLSHIISPALSQGKVSFYFYDNVDPGNPLEIVAAVKDSLNHYQWLGVRSPLFANNYDLSIDGSELNSGVVRSVGWHKFEFYVSKDQTFAAIDGTALKSVGFSGVLMDWSEFKIKSGWGATGATRIDGVKIESSDIPLAENISLSPNNAVGTTQTFTTRIKSLTGQNYFENAFVQFSDAGPEEANSDITLLYAVIKDSSGQFKFYGPRWLGTPPNIATPNIGFKDSYAYDVGGIAGGSAGQICTNTTRQSSISQTADSIGCLDVSQSSAVWNAGTQELVINWKINFLPNFVNVRAIRRFFPAPSLGIRPTSVYLSVDNPLRYMAATQYYYERYNWNQIGSYAVGTAVNHSTITPVSGKANRQLFTTTINHPTDASQITEAYLWLDEDQPSAQRSDVAVNFGVKKTTSGYNFYGRSYLGANTSCPNNPFPYFGPDCYLNYDYNVGPVTPGSSINLYYNLNRITYLNPGGRVTGILHAATSSIRINPTNSKQLIISWDIEFPAFVGPRSFSTYVRWTGTNSTSGNWQQVGTFDTNYSLPDHGAIKVASDNKHLQFTDGTPYTWIGINRYLLDRFYSAAEMDGEFAKMSLYGMNFARIWVLSRNPLINEMKTMNLLAKKHGIYIDLMIFNDGWGNVRQEASPYNNAKDWASYIVNLTSQMDSVFMLDILNDADINYDLNWLQSLIPYVKSINTKNKLVTIQLGGGQTVNNSALNAIRLLLDTYSIRSYASDANQIIVNLDSQYQQTLLAIPAKPIYVGESRWLNYNVYYTTNWQELNQSSIDAVTESVLHEAQRLGLPGAHLWTQDFRAENLLSPTNIYPNLSPQEYSSFLRFKPLPGDTDSNGKIDRSDLQSMFSGWFSRYNALDAALVILNYGR